MRSPWREEIPRDWEMIPLKYITRSTTGGTPSKGVDEFWDGEIPWVSSKDMKSSLIDETEDYVTRDAVENSSTTLVPEGSLLVVSRSGILEHSIPVAVSGRELAINQDIRAYVPQKSSISASYLRNIIVAFEADLLDLWRQQGATVQSLDSEAVAQTEFPIPLGERQKHIERYSRSVYEQVEEAKIRIQDLISVLEDKRHSRITRGVIGCDEYIDIQADIKAALESSIPEHWETGNLRWVTSKIGSGSTPDGGSEAYVDEGIPFIRSQNVTDRGLFLEDVVYIPESIHKEMNSTHLHCGDVLLNITGASLGRTSIVPENFTVGNVNQHVCILRAVKNHISPEYLNFVMSSAVGQAQIFANQSGASRQAVTFSQIGDFVVPLPPISEQKEISRELNEYVTRTNRLIDKLQNLDSVLGEKRKDLIRKAVTGQIDLTGGNSPDN